MNTLDFEKIAEREKIDVYNYKMNSKAKIIKLDD